MTAPDTRPLSERIAEIEEHAPPGEWVTHDGGGRPHKPGDYVEMVRRNGTTRAGVSAFFRWLWADPEYDEDDDPQEDVMRWRFVQRPPSDRQLAALVPDIIAEYRRMREVLGDCCEVLKHIHEDGDMQLSINAVVTVARAALSETAS